MICSKRNEPVPHLRQVLCCGDQLRDKGLTDTDTLLSTGTEVNILLPIAIGIV